MSKHFLFPSGGPVTLLKLASDSGGIHPSRILRLVITVLKLTLSYPAVLLERYYYAKEIHRVTIGESPVFIIGHYRSGTSLMYKLLSADPRWRFINEYELLFPHHSVSVEFRLKPIVQRLIQRLKIKHPNFNDYPVNLDDPNEDEALLVSMGAPWSSYWAFIFPSHAEKFVRKSICFDSAEHRSLWKASYLFFLKRLLWRKGGRLLLKSPPSTGRVRALLELFPDAKFIYLYRNQHQVHRSMQKIWKQEILKYFCLQKPGESDIHKQSMDMYQILLESYAGDKALIPRQNLVEVCYEQFVQDPRQWIVQIYSQWGLTLDDRVWKLIVDKINAQRDYHVSTYS